MDIEYLNALWQQDDGGARFSISAEDLHHRLRHRAERFERQVSRRDWLELITGVLCGAFFVANALFILPNAEDTHWSEHWDWLLLGAGCWWVSGSFMRERRRARNYLPCADDDIRTTLLRQCDSLRHQIRLLERIAWWYVSPIAVPIVFVTVRSFPPDWQLPYGVVVMLLTVAIIAGNRWYASRRLAPRLRANEQLLEEVS